ncbi:MAG: hypothetical protein ABIL20_05365, partial [candidate division WOR-3 bacterium]
TNRQKSMGIDAGMVVGLLLLVCKTNIPNPTTNPASKPQPTNHLSASLLSPINYQSYFFCKAKTLS